MRNEIELKNDFINEFQKTLTLFNINLEIIKYLKETTQQNKTAYNYSKYTIVTYDNIEKLINNFVDKIMNVISKSNLSNIINKDTLEKSIYYFLRDSFKQNYFKFFSYIRKQNLLIPLNKYKLIIDFFDSNYYYLCDVVHFLEKYFYDIVNSFNIGEFKILGIRQCGDRHPEGQCMMRLYLGTKSLYIKPKYHNNEIIVSEILDFSKKFFIDEHLKVSIPTFNYFGDFVISLEVTNNSKPSLLALSQMNEFIKYFRIFDLHSENVIFCNDKVYLIDLECFKYPHHLISKNGFSFFLEDIFRNNNLKYDKHISLDNLNMRKFLYNHKDDISTIISKYICKTRILYRETSFYQRLIMCANHPFVLSNNIITKDLIITFLNLYSDVPSCVLDNEFFSILRSEIPLFYE